MNAYRPLCTASQLLYQLPLWAHFTSDKKHYVTLASLVGLGARPAQLRRGAVPALPHRPAGSGRPERVPRRYTGAFYIGGKF